jgi:UDP-GlcNAc:undecaprenyl-phosphate GlcNAc-1-phosphate transferase
MQSSIFILLLISFLINLIFIKFNFLKKDYDNPQKIHTGYIPKLGGISIIFFNFLIIDLMGYVLIFLPLFIASLYEDINNQGNIKIRFICTLIVSVLFCVYFETIQQIDTPILSNLMSYQFFAVMLTTIAIASITQCFNLIDGLNGQTVFNFCFIVLSLLIFEKFDGNTTQVYFYLYFLISCLPFIILNFPFGKIFLGDHGAYFLGFLAATLVIEFFNSHQELFSWNAILILIYPIFELLFTISRRLIIGKKVLLPDTFHIHSLVYKIVNDKLSFKDNFKNSIATILLLPLYIYGPISFLIFNDSFNVVLISVFFYCFIYSVLYIILFKFTRDHSL